MLRGKRSRYRDPCCSGHGTEDHKNSRKSPSYRAREKRAWKKDQNG
jgi:hypothetical protein